MINIDYRKTKKVRERVLMLLLDFGAPLYLRYFFNAKAPSLKLENLSHYPANTLGYELGLFYRRNNIEPLPGLIGHDLLHVMLGYATSVQDEVKMQYFLFGNGKRNLSTLGAVSAALIIFPEQAHLYRSQYVKGKQYHKIWGYNFYAMLAQNISEIKQQTFKTR